MKIRLLSVTALSLVFTASISMAGEKLSDAALKQKLLGTRGGVGCTLAGSFSDP
jgi:hypothetical protein